MPLLLLDLDNTLLDRAAAFRSWAEDFAGGLDGSDADVAWLIEADRDGYEPREAFARAILERFGLGGTAAIRLADDLHRGMVDRMTLDPEVPRALTQARDAGWVPVVVTNGTTEQQERKIRHTGLESSVAGWVVSESAGVAKPDRRIFDLAARSAGLPLLGAWMVGDSGPADIGGAHRAGIASVWLHRGRSWTETAFAPSAIADDCAGAIDHIVTG
ncbi:HAD family hydrolase [Jiangella endophytica]|uniref:HAD family hydrolase n=1 Tax=Jiangella endophytica TaxID=1623398 RepID=UPI000E34C8A2|nr:HAD-IA family hydrolase [Jiangella endophytica]